MTVFYYLKTNVICITDVKDLFKTLNKKHC